MMEESDLRTDKVPSINNNDGNTWVTLLIGSIFSLIILPLDKYSIFYWIILVILIIALIVIIKIMYFKKTTNNRKKVLLVFSVIINNFKIHFLYFLFVAVSFNMILNALLVNQYIKEAKKIVDTNEKNYTYAEELKEVSNQLKSTLNDYINKATVIAGKLNNFYIGNDFINPFLYCKRDEATNLKYNYLGQGTWFAYGRIQELEIVNSIFLKLSINHKDGIGLFYGPPNLWIEDAHKAGIPVSNQNPCVGDLAVWNPNENDSGFYYYRIGVVEKISEDGQVFVSQSNLTIYDNEKKVSRLLDGVKHIVICEDHQESADSQGVINSYGVYLYDKACMSANDISTTYKEPLEAGDIFRILDSKEKCESVVKGKTVYSNWYRVAGYTKGNFQSGWIKLEARRIPESESECVEFNFTGIDFDGHELGWGWARFNPASVLYIHLSQLESKNKVDYSK